VEVPATCPHCEAAFIWEVDLRVDRELAWAAPEGPAFRFRCEACDGEVRVALGFGLERGADPRPLRLVGGPSSLPSRPQILLVDHCPHGCGARLGLELDADDPGTRQRAWPDAPLVLGGYRCPRCDGEGRLFIQVAVLGGADSP